MAPPHPRFSIGVETLILFHVLSIIFLPLILCALLYITCKRTGKSSCHMALNPTHDTPFIPSFVSDVTRSTLALESCLDTARPGVLTSLYL